MLAGPHLAVGALIGRTSRRAWVAWPLAFVSHYALDALPHSYLSLRQPGALPLKLAIAAADAAVGLLLVAWIARPPRHRALTLLDLMKPVTSFGRWLGEAPGTAWLISAHLHVAYHVPFGQHWLLGFGPSVGVLLLVAGVTRWLGGRQP
jgi:hypothetical protein